MTKDHRRRTARQKLKAHDAGRDRHSKGVELLKKEQRAKQERAALSLKRKPKAEKTTKLSLLARAKRASAEQRTRLGN